MNSYKKFLEEFSLEESHLVINLNDFEYGEIIGKGGFGEVKKAIFKKNKKICAIKEIYNERLEGNRFRRYLGEIETLAQCDNMFLVPFIGFTINPPYAIVTEYMSNGSLDKFIRGKSNENTLTGTQLTQIAIGISFGMLHLHENGIIHRDLKAANILLDSNLFPRICDFGIARFEENGDIGMTAKIGTPNYMAPELITSTEYDRKVDVYAFAMILYEMSEHIRPFKGMKIADIFKSVIEFDERPHLTNKTPQSLQKLIKICWDKDPNIRPTFLEIFEAFSNGKVSFPNTKKNEILNFLQIIDKDETEREENAKKKIKENIQKIEDDEIIENENSDDNDANQILLDSKSKEFKRYVEYYSKSIELTQFLPFYNPLSKHLILNISLEIYEFLLNNFNFLIKIKKKFIKLFNK